MSLQHQHAQGLGAHQVERLAQQQEVVEALGHLLDLAGGGVGDLQHARVHPVARERGAVGRLGLGDLVLMMGEDEVAAAAVDVEGEPQVLVAHRGALDVPAGAAVAPRALPAGLAGLGGLPQGEVERVALAVLEALAVCPQLPVAALHLVDVAAGELAVPGVAAHREVDVALRLVGVALLDEGLDQADHGADLLGGLGAHGRVLDAGAAHVLDEGVGVLRGHLGGAAALLVGLLDDLVVDVGDVLDEGHLVAAPLEVAADDIEGDEGARVADVDAVVDGGTAHVHAHLAGLARGELLFAARLRVVDLHDAPWNESGGCGVPAIIS